VNKQDIPAGDAQQQAATGQAGQNISLRGDLRFMLQQDEGKSYVLFDPSRGKYYRIGLEEYIFLSQLQVTRDPVAAARATNMRLGEEFFSEQQFQAMMSWLLANQLLTGDLPTPAEQQSQQSKLLRKMQQLARLNLMTVKLPLLNPDALMRRVNPWLQWLTGPLFALIWAGTVFYGMLALTANKTQFFHQAGAVLSPGNLLFLWAAWFLLKIIHELFHALVCYRYGGKVEEAGVLFVLFFPLTYVNASSSWSFPSRLQRMHAAFAGMYAELFVAAAALLVWQGTANSVVGTIAHNLVLVAGFSSLFFNANPLMRFDGYFIFSDMVMIPNLYLRGRDFMKSVWSWLFMGRWTYMPRYTGGREIIIGGYGALAWFWRLFVMISLLIVASYMFHGLGIIVTALSLMVTIIYPARALAARIWALRADDPPVFRRVLLRVPVFAAVLAVCLVGIQWQPHVQAPAVVRYRNDVIVKVPVSGFIKQIFVHPGDRVAADTPLYQLDNPELLVDRDLMKNEIERLELQGRSAFLLGDMGSYQIIEKRKGLFHEKLAALLDDIEHLTVRAPVSGTVLALHPEKSLGAYLRKGRPFLQLVSEAEKELVASVGQDDIRAFRDNKSGRVAILVAGKLDRLPGAVEQIYPKGSTMPSSLALSAVVGGPVPVRARMASPQLDAGDEESGYEYLTPRFQLHVDLSDDTAKQLKAGQVVYVETVASATSLWAALREVVEEVFAARISRRLDI